MKAFILAILVSMLATGTIAKPTNVDPNILPPIPLRLKISFGAGLVVMIWKLKPLNYLFQNKWVAVLGLLAIDLSQFLAK